MSNSVLQKKLSKAGALIAVAFFIGAGYAIANPKNIKLKQMSTGDFPSSLELADLNPAAWPATAPTSMAQLKAIGFPDPALCCDVQTNGKSPGNYTAPDGGTVSVYKNPGNYTYKLKNGIKVWSSPKTLITLEYGEHKVLSYRMTEGRLSNWNRRAIWIFPDGTQLVRYYNPAFKRFIYQHASNERIVDFLDMQDILPESRKGDGFDFWYKADYAHVVDLYLKSERRGKFNAWIKQNFPQPAGQKLPFLFFENVKEYNDFLQEKKQAMAGGRGFAGMAILCCGDSYGKAPADEAAEQDFYNKHHFSILIHELTHTRMKQACFTYDGYIENKSEYVGRVYSEGMAELAVTEVNEYYRDYLLKKARQLIKERAWTYASLDQTRGKKYYGLMFAFWDYLRQKHGWQKVVDYHKASCLGQKNDAAARFLWGKSLPELFAGFIKEFK